MRKLSLFKQSSFIAYGYFILLEKTVVYIINRTIHVCLEIPDLFHVQLNTRNKPGISDHPCIILYIQDLKSSKFLLSKFCARAILIRKYAPPGFLTFKFTQLTHYVWVQ